MIPFFGIGPDQLADSCVGEPPKVAKVKFKVDDGTRKKRSINCTFRSFRTYNVFATLYKLTRISNEACYYLIE